MTVDNDLEAQNQAERVSRSRQLRETAQHAKELLQERTADVRDLSRRYADVAGRRIGTAGRSVTGVVREKPVTTTLAVLGAALLVGAFFAARSPGTLKKLAATV